MFMVCSKGGTKMNKYSIKVNKELINKLKPYWQEFLCISSKYWGEINRLEEKMSKEIKLGTLEIFHCDNEAVGIGNVERTMKLIHREQLEK